MNDVEPEGDNRPEDLDTTAPNPPATEKPAGGWAMPEPKFQQSSGYLPQGGYIDQVNASMNPVAQAEGALEPAPEPPAEVPAEAFAPAQVDAVVDQAPDVDVEPQPDLNEQLEETPAAFTPTPVIKDNGSGRSVVMVVLGVLAMALFIVAFLAVIYFLFIAPNGGESQF